jgi:hypothetical protein
MLSQKLRYPQNPAPIQKWAAIAVPLFVFAMWFKYQLLFVDTLSPMNTQPVNLATRVGSLNSYFTLLIAGAVITAGYRTVNTNRAQGKKLLSAGLIPFGAFFVIFSLVALSVPVYTSFWYLTDFWMLTLPVLGIALLAYFNRQVS